MLIDSKQVEEYTEFSIVKARCASGKIKHDILKAQMEIFAVCGHKFEKYNTIPEEVQQVCIELAEYYALIAGDESTVKGYVSERIGDYSYQLNADGTIKKPVYLNMLKDYILTNQSSTSNKVRFRMRAI
ncbi:DUF3199 family protein [Clostridium sp. HMP27]|uniref:protein YqbG n=1 Tax=Clostridium sp. HMP27 TaxID=1487921 RepID=UPI00052CED0C|nr:DUF3199 family protein [Clostridium sp. HMP27]KGK88035.1 hypothetical protein DP68_08895 [Clostridium sp. HMP27]